MRNKHIVSFFQNEPLITNWENLKSSSSLTGGSIFCGIGLMSQTQIGESLPFDILTFFFVSEIIRQALKMERVFILIADNHAKSNHLCSPSIIDALSKKRERELLKIKRNFLFNQFEIIKASEIHSQKSFQNILEHLPPMNNQYLKLEVADIIWFQNNHNLKLKVGWSVAKVRNNTKHDERFFDQEILKFCPKIAFVYLKAGRTLDKIKSKASPYLSVVGEHRILISPNENVTQKLADASLDAETVKAQISQLHDIVHAFEKIQGRLPFTTLEDKVQFLINKACF